ncbi:hypothetical protein [Nocardia terpenica]|uniref:Uncharacterized protein n=1 Tax=Nocardia terpenica TaxID=455432 RepID=A0A164K6P0_9NOCA|nr:hypothetical protein [Nocardia terpenica]KZM71091.1 hypothetical protein AWN90_42015 [Nocardia terpenica]NQE89582.1 hypothetical protein [Nocardia terpenica]
MGEVVGGRILRVFRDCFDEASAVETAGCVGGTQEGVWAARHWLQHDPDPAPHGRVRDVVRSTQLPRHGQRLTWQPPAYGPWHHILLLVEKANGTVTTRSLGRSISVWAWVELHATGIWPLLHPPERARIGEAVQAHMDRYIDQRDWWLELIEVVRELGVESLEQFRARVTRSYLDVDDPDPDYVYLRMGDNVVNAVDEYMFDMTAAYIRDSGPDLRETAWWT